MRELVCTVGGEVRGNENRKGWLARVARVAGISPRSASAAFYGEPIGKVFAAGIEAKLRAALDRQEAKARGEFTEIRQQLETLQRRLDALDSDFHRPNIDGYRAVLRAADGKDSPA